MIFAIEREIVSLPIRFRSSYEQIDYEFTVRPRCEVPNGWLVCLTHPSVKGVPEGSTWPHLEYSGAHKLVFICRHHGPEGQR